MFGLDVETLRRIRGAIDQVTPIEKVLIYGSRAMGNYHTGSDLDITLLGHGLTWKNGISPLISKLDALYTPYMFDISILQDISDLNVVDHILRRGLVFYERGQDYGLEGSSCSQSNKAHKADKLVSSSPGAKGEALATGVHNQKNQKSGDASQSLKKATNDVNAGPKSKRECYRRAREFENFEQASALGEKNSDSGTRHSRCSRQTDALQNLFSKTSPLASGIQRQSKKQKSNTNALRQNVSDKASAEFAAPSRKWRLVKLGDVCKTTSGGTPLKSRQEYYQNGTIPWLRSGEVAQGLVYNSETFITEDGLKSSSAKIFPVDTVLVAMYGATAGQVGLLKFEASTNQAVCGILPNKRYIPEFLFLTLKSLKKELVQRSVGGAQPNISQNVIKDTTIPLPPLDVQKQIVGQVERAFGALDVAIKNTEQNLKNVKELFQSVLERTLAGQNCSPLNEADKADKLVSSSPEAKGEAFENFGQASALGETNLDSGTRSSRCSRQTDALQNLFSKASPLASSVHNQKKQKSNNSALRQNVSDKASAELFAPSRKWRLAKLGDVCEIIAGQSPEGKFYNSNQQGTPFYQGKKEFGPIFLGQATKWTTQVTKAAKKDDILMSVRAPVGPVNIATENICIGRGLAAIRSINSDHMFLFYFLRSMQDKIAGSQGSVFASISRDQIKKIPIPLPPLEVQKQIVDKIEKIKKQNDVFIEAYQQKLKCLKELKQSLLERALAGKLFNINDKAERKRG